MLLSTTILISLLMDDPDQEKPKTLSEITKDIKREFKLDVPSPSIVYNQSRNSLFFSGAPSSTRETGTTLYKKKGLLNYYFQEEISIKRQTKKNLRNQSSISPQQLKAKKKRPVVIASASQKSKRRKVARGSGRLFMQPVPKQAPLLFLELPNPLFSLKFQANSFSSNAPSPTVNFIKDIEQELGIVSPAQPAQKATISFTGKKPKLESQAKKPSPNAQQDLNKKIIPEIKIPTFPKASLPIVSLKPPSIALETTIISPVPSGPTAGSEPIPAASQIKAAEISQEPQITPIFNIGEILARHIQFPDEGGEVENLPVLPPEDFFAAYEIGMQQGENLI